MAKDILIVDDEQDIRELVAGILEDEGYSVRTAGGSDAALATISERRPSMVFLDIWLQGPRSWTGCSFSNRSSSGTRIFPWS